MNAEFQDDFKPIRTVVSNDANTYTKLQHINTESDDENNSNLAPENNSINRPQCTCLPLVLVLLCWEKSFVQNFFLLNFKYFSYIISPPFLNSGSF